MATNRLTAALREGDLDAAKELYNRQIPRDCLEAALAEAMARGDTDTTTWLVDTITASNWDEEEPEPEPEPETPTQIHAAPVEDPDEFGGWGFGTSLPKMEF
tara:strand:+ start:78 stop:383 length:306 start_codon:yes stop_codon:yes gene_type:complete